MEASLSLPELLSIQPALTAAPSTDAELVFRVRAGDEAAFEQLYLAYHDRLWKFAFGEVRASEIAEELVQDVFLALWRDRARWDVRTSVRAWLYAAVRHHARNHRRHERVAARFRDQVTASSNDQPATSEDGGTCMGNTAPGAQVAMEAKELGGPTRAGVRGPALVRSVALGYSRFHIQSEDGVHRAVPAW